MKNFQISNMFFDKDILKALEKAHIKKYYVDKLMNNYATYYYFPREIKKDQFILALYIQFKKKNKYK